ncbi:MAG TPA: antibiotic biosynthesis monooxygenase [Egibacteraceae bacterium]|nr:antibiotic biosynthesis monooxygenase [Egibacteraceae bacterium]
MATAAFAVTTRSRLRGFHRFPQMFIASRRIRRQLAETPGCVRFASIIAGPREFWTITVWENRDKMLDFMRSGAHEDIMWLFGKWLESFWLMRWRPTVEEIGLWSGDTLGPTDDGRRKSRPRTPREQEALEAALDALPVLKASAGPEGAPTYDTSPAARRHRRAVSGAAAIVLRIEADSLDQSFLAWREMRRVRRRLRASDAVLRSVTGFSGTRDHYALAVLRDEAACSQFLADAQQHRMHERWGDRCWMMRWQPENEFGHWDALRLRREPLGTGGSAIPVPEDAARAAVVPGEGDE